ncbi:MAG TPA: hypothetical protein VJV78_09515 [Polyangiales bacterium]|nr:hypothetical protein [Polyangiales bacterium]
MAESARIQDIQERLQDFTAALRTAGAAQKAQRLERYASGFVRQSEVRRSVAAILEQLRYFRNYPEELPDLPIVQVAANRLEDVCREALAGGLIEAARPSLRAASKRKLGVVITTLAAAGLCFALPLGLIMFGVDFDDLLARRVTAPARVPQGEEVHVSVNALVASAEPTATKRVEFYVRDHCSGELGGGVQCKAAEPREFDGVVRPSYEVTLHNQVYGLFVGFADGTLLGSVGNGEVWLAATWDTPEGRYELPLQAAFVGYTPEHCNLLDRALDRCTPRRLGDDARHEDLPVPTVIIDVVKGDRARVAGAKQKREQERQQQRAQAAEERASELAQNVEQIKAVLDDTQRMLRKQQWEAMRERVDKLTQLFSPLDALAVGGGEGEPLPAEVAGLRARFEEQRRQVQAFEERAFESAFQATRANPPPANQGLLSAARGDLLAATEGGGDAPAGDTRLADVARKLRISPEYLDAIYAAHAEQLEKRLAEAEAARRAKEQAAQASLLRRCGELPRNAFNEVKGYLSAMGHSVRVRVRLNECMTPRLSEKLCWSVVCNFDELVPGELTDTSRQHKWTFVLKNGRVTEHLEKVLD